MPNARKAVILRTHYEPSTEFPTTVEVDEDDGDQYDQSEPLVDAIQLGDPKGKTTTKKKSSSKKHKTSTKKKKKGSSKKTSKKGSKVSCW